MINKTTILNRKLMRLKMAQTLLMLHRYACLSAISIHDSRLLKAPHDTNNDSTFQFYKFFYSSASVSVETYL